MKFPPAEAVTTSRGRFAVRQLGNGPDLVLIHGWPQSSYCWKAISLALSDRFRLTLPDLRGLGDSERTPGVEPYQKNQLAQDVISLLDELGINRFGLTGHDFGGAVSQELTLACPERVRRLALINISIITNGKGNIEAQAELHANGNRVNWYQHFQQVDGLAEALIPGNEEAWLRCFLRKLPEDSIQEYVRCYGIEGTPGAAAGLYRAFPSDIKRWVAMAGTVIPVEALYIHGNRDPVVIGTFLHHAEDCFPQLRVEHLDCGHFVPEERPEDVANLLGEFFAT